MKFIEAIKGLKRNLTDCACPESGAVKVTKIKGKYNQNKIVIKLNK